MTYIKINGNLYPATVSGRVQDREWDGRESKAITLKGEFSMVDALFVNGLEWSIVQENIETVTDGDGNTTKQTKQTEYDNSDFCIRGDLTVHVDGTCTVEMGKPTDLETAYELLYGGI